MGTPKLAKSLLLLGSTRSIPYGARPTLLPFLYQTTTIQGLTTTSSCNAQRSRGQRPRGTKPRKYTDRSHDIPFENLVEAAAEPKGPLKAEKDNSSLSATERAAFEKLFERLGKAATPVESTSKVEIGSQDQSTLETEVQSLSPEQRDVHLARLPVSIRPLAESALQRITDATKSSSSGGLGRDTSTNGNEGATSSTEDDIDAQLEKHLDHIEALFKKQPTDLGVWEVLQREFFEPLKLLDLDGMQRGDKGTKKSKAVEPTTTASPEMVLTSVPHVTLLAFDYLHKRYPASQLSMSILPQLKRISRTAHTLALSPDLYASILSADWSRRSSPSATISILQEMEAEGVELDRTVLASLLPIVQEATSMRDGAHGEPVKLICSMEGWEDRLVELRRVWVPLVRRRIVDAAVREAHEREEQLMRDAQVVEGGSGHAGQLL